MSLARATGFARERGTLEKPKLRASVCACLWAWVWVAAVRVVHRPGKLPLPERTWAIQGGPRPQWQRQFIIIVVVVKVIILPSTRTRRRPSWA